MYTSSSLPIGPPGIVGDPGEEGPEGFIYDGDPGTLTCLSHGSSFSL